MQATPLDLGERKFLMADEEIPITLEAKLFDKYLAKLKDAMLHPLRVANDIRSINVIDDITLEELQKKKADKDPSGYLLNAIKAYVRSRRKRDSKEFRDILDIFKRYIPLCHIAKDIEDEYSKP